MHCLWASLLSFSSEIYFYHQSRLLEIFLEKSWFCKIYVLCAMVVWCSILTRWCPARCCGTRGVKNTKRWKEMHSAVIKLIDPYYLTLALMYSSWNYSSGTKEGKLISEKRRDISSPHDLCPAYICFRTLYLRPPYFWNPMFRGTESNSLFTSSKLQNSLFLKSNVWITLIRSSPRQMNKC
jgi:hypothetical protein